MLRCAQQCDDLGVVYDHTGCPTCICLGKPLKSHAPIETSETAKATGISELENTNQSAENLDATISETHHTTSEPMRSSTSAVYTVEDQSEEPHDIPRGGDYVRGLMEDMTGVSTDTVSGGDGDDGYATVEQSAEESISSETSVEDNISKCWNVMP